MRIELIALDRAIQNLFGLSSYESASTISSYQEVANFSNEFSNDSTYCEIVLMLMGTESDRFFGRLALDLLCKGFSVIGTMR